MIQVSGLLEWSEMFGKLIERGVMLVLIHVNHQSSPNQHSVTEESVWFGNALRELRVHCIPKKHYFYFCLA